MSEDTATVDALEAETVDALEAKDDAQEAESKDDALSPEAARKLRSESKSLRERLKQAEERLKERENGELSEKQQLERDLKTNSDRASALEATNRALRVQVAAHKIGVRDPEAAAKLLDWDSVEDPDDDRSVVKALRDLAKKHPALIGGTESVDGGARGTQLGEKASLGSFMRREAGLRA